MCHLRLVAAIALVIAPPAHAQTACQPVILPESSETVAIEGQVGPEEVVCYAITPVPGRNLGLAVDGTNIAFSWSDGFNGEDAQAETRLVPEGPQVEVRVFQLMRSVQVEAFRLIVTVLPGGNG